MSENKTGIQLDISVNMIDSYLKIARQMLVKTPNPSDDNSNLILNISTAGKSDFEDRVVMLLLVFGMLELIHDLVGNTEDDDAFNQFKTILKRGAARAQELGILADYSVEDTARPMLH